MSIYLRKESGLWQYEFEYKGVRHRGTTGTKSKTEAREIEAQKRREAKEDAEAARAGVKRMTMYELAQKWLEASANTHRDHKGNISRVRKLFGSELRLEAGEWVEHENVRAGISKTLGVHEITQPVLTTLRDARVREGNSAGTINREMSLVQSLLGYGPSIGAVMPTVPIVWSQKRNRAASLKMKEPKGNPRWLRESEEVALLSALAQEADRRNDQASKDNVDLTLFLLDTGARYNEVARIRWSVVDLETGTINLYRSKTENESELRLPARTLQMLRTRRKSMSAACSYVFPALNGRSWSGEDKPRGHATSSIQRHIDLCGLNDNAMKAGRVTPHTFRHTFASRLLQAGVSLSKVSKLLGHANEATTQIYAHLCPVATGSEVADVLNRLHGNKSAQGDDLNAAPAKSALAIKSAQGDDLNAVPTKAATVNVHTHSNLIQFSAVPQMKNWWAVLGLNQGPTDYESAALTN